MPCSLRAAGTQAPGLSSQSKLLLDFRQTRSRFFNLPCGGFDLLNGLSTPELIRANNSRIKIIMFQIKCVSPSLTCPARLQVSALPKVTNRFAVGDVDWLID